MARHYVNAEIPIQAVGRAARFQFPVWRNDEKLGTLAVTLRGIGWKRVHKQSFVWMTWTQLDSFFEDID